MSPPPPTRQVFISHSATDRAAADAIRAALEAAGLSCWIAPRDIPPGAEWATAIMAGIAEARLVLLIHSASSAASQMVRREVNVAVDGRTPVIPVRIDAALPQEGMQFYLGSTHWLDASDGPIAAHLPRIAAAVAERLGAESRPAAPEAAPARPALALPDKPSIAVLPFANMSGDAEQEYFADGMAEEIITALSRIRSFFVIARNSSFTYKGRAVDVKQVGRELGVRFVVEGSVRKGGNRLRITAQLADAIAGTQLWADRFDGALEDVFDLQDRVTASIIGAIQPRIRSVEIERAQRKPPENLLAYDLLLRALPYRWRVDREAHAVATRLLREATELDPTYALAWARRANFGWIPVTAGWLTDTGPQLAEIIGFARRALQHGGDDPEVLTAASPHVALAGGDMPGGLALVEKALALNPNSVEALNIAAHLYAYIGQTDRVIAYTERAARLNPFEDVSMRSLALVVAHFATGQYEEVVTAAVAALQAQPGFPATLRYRTASLALLGRNAEARQSAADLLAVVPEATVARARRHLEVDLNNAHKVPGVVDALCEGLRRAGVPEG